MSGKYKAREMLKWSLSRIIAKLTTEGCQSYRVTMDAWHLLLSTGIECTGTRMDLNVIRALRVHAGG